VAATISNQPHFQALLCFCLEFLVKRHCAQKWQKRNPKAKGVVALHSLQASK